MKILARMLLGAAIGLAVSALIWVGELTDETLASNPLTLLDVAMLSLGGSIAALVYYHLRGFATRGIGENYLVWGLVGAIGGAFLGVPELLSSSSATGVIGGATFGLVGGLGLRVTLRYLGDRIERD